MIFSKLQEFENNIKGWRKITFETSKKYAKFCE